MALHLSFLSIETGYFFNAFSKAFCSFFDHGFKSTLGASGAFGVVLGEFFGLSFFLSSSFS
mgnify:CR=1 FL=1